ncbi:DUF551 domain-containing protein [Klebsiella pneumoniae]|uniref:DUF551 domain-containing protein n=1 Tax=Klebsiella pneumoniae TaxID=573 RepID=UPI0034D434DE
MTSKLTRERLQEIAEDGFLKHGESKELARIALAAMDSESGCLPLDYLQGQKDGLEWAAQLAEANHPETGDWLYDDPIELAKAIRKGPDMPPAQPVADSEPVIVVGDDGGDALSYRRLIQSFEPGTKLYRHAQPAPVVPDEKDKTVDADDHPLLWSFNEGWNACRAAMLVAAPQSHGSEPATVPGKWIPVSERMPEVGDIVLTAMGGVVNVGETECSAANCRFFTSVISGRELPATHWMPLPAAPQEVSDA